MNTPLKRYYRKQVDLFNLIEKIKLWPSKKGTLHGLHTITIKGDFAQLKTHCGETFVVRRSRHSRAARWLRNKWYQDVCSRCRVPEWKIDKYAATGFAQHHGSDLKHQRSQIQMEGLTNE